MSSYLKVEQRDRWMMNKDDELSELYERLITA